MSIRGRGNFDLYEDGLAPQGWILPPEGGPGGERKRGADVSASLNHLIFCQGDGLSPQEDDLTP